MLILFGRLRKKNKSYSGSAYKGLLGIKEVLVGVQFDKMSEIFYKCCTHVNKVKNFGKEIEFCKLKKFGFFF